MAEAAYMNPRFVAASLFLNAASSVIGFAGYSAGPRLGEPFITLGYLAFVVWSLALLPAVFYFYYRRSTAASLAQRRLALLVGAAVVVSGVSLQTLLSLRMTSLGQSIGWNFASAGGVGLWLILIHLRVEQELPHGLAWLGVGIGSTWLAAFGLLGADGFPVGGARGNWMATIGFGADATAYFASIVWAIWLGFSLGRRPSEIAS